MKKSATAPIWARFKLDSYAKIFGGGEYGERMAALILEIQHDLPLGSLTRKTGPDGPEHGPGEAESNSIRPNPTKSNQ